LQSPLAAAGQSLQAGDDYSLDSLAPDLQATNSNEQGKKERSK